jgi:hypothetical protein
MRSEARRTFPNCESLKKIGGTGKNEEKFLAVKSKYDRKHRTSQHTLSTSRKALKGAAESAVSGLFVFVGLV